MTIGTLDNRITIQSETRTADDYGGAALAWTDVATVWANVRPLTGREHGNMGAVEAPAVYRFTIRRRGGLTEGMRISWNSQAFNVRVIADPGARALYMTIDAERGVAV